MDEPRNRKWDTGTVRPYRASPVDFREVFLRMGQSKEIEEHYRTNWRCIMRWIDQNGGDALREERAKIGGKGLRPGRRARSRRYAYVMGTTRMPTFFDYELIGKDGK